MDDKKTKVAITGKISASTKVLQESILLDKPHTILPAIMMVEGAYFPSIENAGRPTSLFFSSFDLKQSTSTWNGRPVAVNHPDGQDTCNSPDTFNKQWVGYVFNTRYEEESGSLKADLWIDSERGKTITNRIKLGDQIDVSIGAFGDLIPSVSNSKETKEYDYKMTNIVGDHLAVLPDGTGACSWKDGCGIRASVFSFRKDRERLYTDGLNNKEGVKLEKMSDCTEKETSVSAVTKNEKTHVDVAEKRAAANFNKDEWLSQAPEDVQAYLVNAMNNYEVAKERHLDSIVSCEQVKFCREALGKIKDVTLLESIAALVTAKAGKAEENQLPGGSADNQLRSVAASNADSDSGWAKFKDVDWQN